MKATIAIFARGQISNGTYLSILPTTDHETREKYGIDGIFYTVVEGIPLEIARSMMATSFLSNKGLGDVLFMLDSDLSFEVTDCFRIIRNCQILKTVISGLYVTKQRKNSHIVACGWDEVIHFPLRSGMKLMRYLPTGFLAIHRSVLAKVSEKMKLVLDVGGDIEFYPFFINMLAKNPAGKTIYLSEDYAWSERCNRLGFHMLLDTDGFLRHIGNYDYTVNDQKEQNDSKIDMRHT